LEGKPHQLHHLDLCLGQTGINIGDFVNQFNTATKDQMGEMTSVAMTIFDDRTFEFVIKTPPMSAMLKKAAGITSGSGSNAKKKAGSITQAQLREIAEKKLPDLNTSDVEAAMKTVSGSARSMGIEIK
jgi:large subunit ribosomal protein L11